jgi:hypothetical protein
MDPVAAGQGGCTGNGCFSGCNGSCTWNLVLLGARAYLILRRIMAV